MGRKEILYYITDRQFIKDYTFSMTFIKFQTGCFRINNMLAVQYPIQFSGHPRNISNSFSAQLCPSDGSTNTTRIAFQALLFTFETLLNNA